MATTPKLMYRGNAATSNSTATFELKQVLESADTVSGSASATTVKFHISGVEVI